MTEIIRRRTTCRGCESSELELVFSLNPSPIGDAYVTGDRLDQAQESYPIDLFMCRRCGLAQIADVIDPEVLYGDYIYLTESSPGLAAHFAGYAESVIGRIGLKPGSLVVDLGSNDGTLLASFKKGGMRVLGVEPARHIAARATANGIETVPRFFGPAVAGEMAAQFGPAQLITANNVFANIDDIVSWVGALNELLSSDGVFVFESCYLADLLRNMVFDFIYHEHLSAFSVRPVKALFERQGLRLAAVERTGTKGGSLRYFIQRPGGPLADDGSVALLLAHEESIGLYRKETFAAFAGKVDLLRRKTAGFLDQLKTQGKSIAGFGASITGTTLIYHFGIGPHLDYLVDDNAAKHGRFSPGLHLPVLPTAELYRRKPDYVLILAWRFAEQFMKNHEAYLADGGRFIIPVPEFQVI